MLSQPNWTHRQTDGQMNFQRTIKCGASSHSPPSYAEFALVVKIIIWRGDKGPAGQISARSSPSWKVYWCSWLSMYLVCWQYRMARNFWGSQFSRLTGDPRKLYICEIKSLNAHSCDVDMHARTIIGGVAIVVHAIDLTAGLLDTGTSSLLLSFFHTNVSNFHHMQLLCHFSISAKDKYDWSIACWLYPSKFELWRTCSKRRSLMDSVGGATLEHPSTKISLWNLWIWSFCEKDPSRISCHTVLSAVPNRTCCPWEF